MTTTLPNGLVGIIMAAENPFTHLRKVNKEEYDDSVFPVFYDCVSGSLYACEDYEAFARACVGSFVAAPDRLYTLMADWTRYDRHTLVFEIDVKTDGGAAAARNAFEVYCRYFDLVFLGALEKHLSPALDRVALLVSVRLDGTGGMRVHCPGIESTHDDYLRLCGLMRDECRFRDGSLLVELNSPSRMSVIGSDEPSRSSVARPYIPVRFVDVRFGPHFNETDCVWVPRKIHQVFFTPWTKKNREQQRLPSSNVSVFEKLVDGLVMEKETDWFKMMMPVENQLFSLVDGRYKIRLFYRTRFVEARRSGKKGEEGVVARWESFANTFHAIVKGTSLEKEVVEKEEEDSKSFSLYRWLRDAVADDLIKRFDVVDKNCGVLKTWHKRSRKLNWIPKEEMNLFSDTERILRKKCAHLRHEKSPLLTLLADPFYRLPAYRALRNVASKKYELPAEHVDEGLRLFFPDTTLQLPVPAAPEEEEAVSERLSMNTVLYCAMHVVPEKTREGLFLQHVGLGGRWRRLFPMLDSLDSLKACLRFFQTHYYPVVKGKTAAAAANDGGGGGDLYAWDPFTETWCRLPSEEEERKTEMEGVLHAVLRHMTYFEGYGGLSSELKVAAAAAVDWTRSIAEEVLKAADEGEAIVESALPENLTEREKTEYVEKHYGPNVPEYYFFTFNPAKGDDTTSFSTTI